MGWLEKEGRYVVNQLPVLGGIAGGVLGTPADAIAGPLGNVAGAGIGGYLGTAAKNAINSYISPEEAPQTTAQALTSPIVGGVHQAGMQAGGELAGAAIGAIGSKIANPVSDYLAKLAEKRAVAATGATGIQATKFAPDAGRQLLDRGIVKFGNSQEGIAANAQAALDQSGQGIGDTLNQLDQQGVTVDRNTVIDYLRKKIAALADNEGEKDLVRQLQGKVQDIEGQIPSDAAEFSADNAAEAAAPSQVPIGKAEEIKRSFDANSKWSSNSDAAALASNQEAANAFRQASEDAATKANPELAQQFQADKDTYNLLNPITEAANKRASIVNQSPPLGFIDTAAAGAGAVIGGKPGAIAAPIARRLLAPRLNSSFAVGSDWLANVVKSAPDALGAYSGVLTQAAARGGNSLPATDYILQQTDPEYRQKLMELKNSQDDFAKNQ